MEKSFLSIYNHYRHFILYGIIGVFCASLDFVLYWLLSQIIYYQLANLISVHTGIICSFLLNRHFNFKVKDHPLHRFAKFYAVGALGWLVSFVILYISVDVMCLNNVICKIVSIIVVAIMQFFLNKFVTFKINNYV